MIKLGYSTSGLVNLDLKQAITAVAKAGYPTIELAFHQEQFNPFQITTTELLEIRKLLDATGVHPACIASPTFFFMPERPHDPSLICMDLAGRKQRIGLIKEAIRIAKILKAPIVSFGSGFIRDELLSGLPVDPQALLIDSIQQCLEDCGEIVLTIEPEPGMYIETLEQGVALVKKINSKNFKLHVDLCHAFCSEKNYLKALREAAPYTKYLHVSDTRDGKNLKVLFFSNQNTYDFSVASYLIYFPDSADFLFLDQEHAIYFYDAEVNETEKQKIAAHVSAANNQIIHYVNYNSLFKGRSSYDGEIKVYAISLPELNFYIIDRLKPIVHYLRTTISQITQRPIMDKKVANTLTGKVHFHELPGEGEIDFSACFEILQEHGFTGAATVELYHHVDVWKESLEHSLRFLTPLLPKKETA